MKKLYILIAFFIAHYSTAQNGALDQTFGEGGKALTSVPGRVINTGKMITLEDGRIVQGGTVYLAPLYDNFSIICYNQDGSVDTTFGTQGQATSFFNDKPCNFHSIIQLMDGKLLAVGGVSNSAGIVDFLFIRYLLDGQIDTSFGNNGYKTTSFSAGADVPYELTQLPSGELLVVGESRVGILSSMIVAKYDLNMNLVQSFGTNGYYVAPTGRSVARDIVVYQDGPFLVGGTESTIGTGTDFAIWKFNANGTLDTNFGINGVTKTDFFAFGDDISQIKIDNDGKIIALGVATVINTQESKYAIAKYNADGTPDLTLNNTGKTFFVKNNRRLFPSAFEILDNGKIAIGGTAFVEFSESEAEFALLFLTNDLIADSSYGVDGWVITNFTGNDRVSTLMQSNGKILCGGRAIASNGTIGKFAVARYGTDSSLSIKEEKIITKISSYPNPATNILNLQVPTYSFGDAKIQIFDQTMRTVKTEFAAENVYKFGNYAVNLDQFSVGVYYLNFKSANLSHTFQFIKN